MSKKLKKGYVIKSCKKCEDYTEMTLYSGKPITVCKRCGKVKKTEILT